MNPYLLLAIVVGWGASVAGAGYAGYGAGKDHVEAVKAREDRTAAIASEAAASAVAASLVKIKVQNTTIRQTLEKEVRENTIYRDCRIDDVALRLLNATISGAAVSASGAGELPASGPAR